MVACGIATAKMAAGQRPLRLIGCGYLARLRNGSGGPASESRGALERLLVLSAYRRLGRQRPVDEVVAHVVVGAGAGVEQRGVPVAVDGK
jgi:hypothetical protein